MNVQNNCTNGDIKEKTVMFDPVHNPNHYMKQGVECRDIQELLVSDIKDPWVATCVATAFKYMFRFESKGGTQDLEKAREYIEFAIERRRGLGK